jgi:hypothetical protein
VDQEHSKMKKCWLPAFDSTASGQLVIASNLQRLEADGDIHITLADATGNNVGTVSAEIPVGPRWCEIRQTVFGWTTQGVTTRWWSGMGTGALHGLAFSLVIYLAKGGPNRKTEAFA